MAKYHRHAERIGSWLLYSQPIIHLGDMHQRPQTPFRTSETVYCRITEIIIELLTKHQPMR